MEFGLYAPAHFRVDDPEVLAGAVDGIVFGTILSVGKAGLAVSHAPFLLNRGAGPKGTLEGHLARANPHAAALDGAEVLVIFQGPQYYVSPSWYATKRETHKVVPTWNYVVVHARGVARTFGDASRLRERVEALTDRMEEGRADRWRVDDAPGDFVQQLVPQVVGVDVELADLQGKFKLGQNRSLRDQQSLASALEAERPEVAASLRRLGL